MTMAWVEHLHADAPTLTAALALELQSGVRRALEARGTALLALAGGRTPLPAYRAIAALPIDWSRVTLLPTDERCVRHDHPACNVAELRRIFSPTRATVESLTTPDGDPDLSEAHARLMLAAHSGPFDVVVLGMGADAHTASLFPNASQLALAIDAQASLEACRMDPDPLPPEAPCSRITLTAARLLRARTVHLVVSGADKRAVLDAAYADADPMRRPVAAILHAPGHVVHVHWSP